jgi:hypothetical protein
MPMQVCSMFEQKNQIDMHPSPLCHHSVGLIKLAGQTAAAQRAGWRWPVLLSLLMTFPLTLSAQNDYLGSLGNEASDGQTKGLAEEGRTGDTTRADFETMLQREYRGTFVFYESLSPQYQQELIDAFRAGTPIAELRERVVDRYFGP